jgi:hypothetical protein
VISFIPRSFPRVLWLVFTMADIPWLTEVVGEPSQTSQGYTKCNELQMK